MEDTAVLSLAAGSKRTEVLSDLVRTDLRLAGLEPDPELGLPLGAGPVVTEKHGALAGDGVGAGGEVGLPTLGGEAGVGEGRVGVGVRHDVEAVVEAASLQIHLHRGHHHLCPVQSLHLEAADDVRDDVGDVGVERVAVRNNLCRQYLQYSRAM